MSAKAEVLRILERLPEDATFEDIQYHIYIREKIEAALMEVRGERIVEQEEVERRMARWLDE